MKSRNENKQYKKNNKTKLWFLGEKAIKLAKF